MPTEKLKKIISHDINAAALQNMDQPTSSESSATFMDQNNMDPLNDSPTSDYINYIDELVSNPGFTEPQNAAPAGRSESHFFFLLFKIYTLILVLLGNLSDKSLVCISLVYGVAQHSFSL